MTDRKQQQRHHILKQIEAIPALRQGQLSEQYYEKVNRHGEVTKQGPYYVLQRQKAGKKQSERVPAEDVDWVREGLKGHQLFKELTQEFSDLTEQTTIREHDRHAKKKPRKSRKTVTGKSSTSSSRLSTSIRKKAGGT